MRISHGSPSTNLKKVFAASKAAEARVSSSPFQCLNDEEALIVIDEATIQNASIRCHEKDTVTNVTKYKNCSNMKESESSGRSHDE